MKTRIVIIATMSAVLLAATGCGKAPAAGPPPGMAVQVVAVEAKRQAVTESLSLVGTLLADEYVEIKTEIDGVVQEVKFEDGQSVKKGDLLVRLDDSKIAASVAEAEARYKLSQVTLGRSKELLESKFTSPQEYDQAAAGFKVTEAGLQLKKRELQDTKIIAPFDGVMSVRRVSPGQVFSRNMVIGVLVALDPLKVEFNVPERVLSQLRIGQKIEVELTAFEGEKFRGEVYFITPIVDPNMRTAAVRARIPNAGFKLKPGMFANLDLTLKVRQSAIVVPEIALMPQGDRLFVYVVDKESKAQLRPIEAGIRMNGLVEITSGVEPGEKVITEGYQKARPGGPVQFAAKASP